MTQFDVLVGGAGPAGAVAATVLARAGARVLLLDRAMFPRHKLCGDSLNPGALALLRRLRLASVADVRGVRLDGMVVTGEGGVRIEGRYPAGLSGRSIGRSELDAALIGEAAAAGAVVRERTTVRRALVETTAGARAVAGVQVSTNGTIDEELRAPVTIAADGRRSTLAVTLGLLRHPRRPRRWAVGAYAENVHGLSNLGEMHIRRGRYFGLAPLPDGLANVCLVLPFAAARGALGDPMAALRNTVMCDPMVSPRMADARLFEPQVLGPLAVDRVRGTRIPQGLLLAGDAAGFVDPMTGDGLRFAIRSGELAAEAALDALAHGWRGVHARWAARCREDFNGKRRFNRLLRALVGSPAAVSAASAAAGIAPGLLQRAIIYAGDCASAHS